MQIVALEIWSVKEPIFYQSLERISISGLNVRIGHVVTSRHHGGQSDSVAHFLRSDLKNGARQPGKYVPIYAQHRLIPQSFNRTILA
jgi:hypothetical protein